MKETIFLWEVENKKREMIILVQNNKLLAVALFYNQHTLKQSFLRPHRRASPKHVRKKKEIEIQKLNISIIP